VDDAEEETEVVDNNNGEAVRPSGRVHRTRVVNEKVVDAASRQ